jgi:hypothetical protein
MCNWIGVGWWVVVVRCTVLGGQLMRKGTHTWTVEITHAANSPGDIMVGVCMYGFLCSSFCCLVGFYLTLDACACVRVCLRQGGHGRVDKPELVV